MYWRTDYKEEARYRREKNWAISWQKALHQQPRIAQATHCPDKQLQKIVQQTLKCQCLKLGERKHSSHTTHYHATAFKHKLTSNSLRYYAPHSPHLPTTEKLNLKITIKLLSVPDNNIKCRGMAPYFWKAAIKQQLWWREGDNQCWPSEDRELFHIKHIKHRLRLCCCSKSRFILTVFWCEYT